MRLNIRDLNEGDLAGFVQANNALYEIFPTTVERRRHEIAVRPPVLNAKDYVAEMDGEVVAYGQLLRAIWLSEPGRGFVHVVPAVEDAEEIEREFMRWLVDRATEEGYNRAYTFCFDTHHDYRRVAKGEGFQIAIKNPVTAIDPQAFDVDHYADAIDRQGKQGIAIRALEDLEREGADWKRSFHELHVAVIQDVPHGEPPQPMPWSYFEEMLADPERYALPGKFVAMDGDRIVGVSEIQTNPADPSLGNTMLTGVLREYRRRRIATALKATALAWAKAQGLRKVYTDNEENNPMLDLNKQLGFTEVLSQLWMYKELEAPHADVEKPEAAVTPAGV